MNLQKLANGKFTVIAFLLIIAASIAVIISVDSVARKLHLVELVSKVRPFLFTVIKPEKEPENILVTKIALPEKHDNKEMKSAWRVGGLTAVTPKIPLNEKIVAYQVVELDQHPTSLPAAGESVQIPMLHGKSVTVDVENVTLNPNGDYSWSGHLRGYGTDYPVIMTYGERTIFAMVTTPEGSYTMESVEGSGWLYKNPAEVELSKPGSKDYLDIPH